MLKATVTAQGQAQARKAVVAQAQDRPVQHALHRPALADDGGRRPAPAHRRAHRARPASPSRSPSRCCRARPRKRRTVGFMRVFVAGQSQRKRYSLKLGKKGRARVRCSQAAGKPIGAATAAAASRCAACPRAPRSSSSRSTASRSSTARRSAASTSLQARVAPALGRDAQRPPAGTALARPGPRPARQRDQRRAGARRRRRARGRPRDRPRARGRRRRAPRAATSARSNAWWAARGRESGPASASPISSTPSEIAATSPAGPAPSRNGPARRARPPISSRAAVDGEGDASGHATRVAHRGPRSSVSRSHRPCTVPRRAPGPPRLPAGGARALFVPHPRRGGGDGGPGAARPGRRARRQAGPARRSRRRARRRRAAALRLARRRSSSRNALDALGLDPAGRRCLDVGASTGGFTDCLLQAGRGARRGARRRLRRARLGAARGRAGDGRSSAPTRAPWSRRSCPTRRT